MKSLYVMITKVYEDCIKHRCEPIQQEQKFDYKIQFFFFFFGLRFISRQE